MKTISIIFIDSKLAKTHYLKRYKFLCAYDQVKIGDIIVDTRYTTKMQVVSISYCTDTVQDGFTLKSIIIDELNGQKMCKNNYYDMDKTRNISITIEQAIEWYNSENATLKTLALNAYTMDELEFNYKMIESNVDQACWCFSIPMCEHKKFIALAKLANIAKYYNKEWKKTTDNTGYFLTNRGTTKDYDVCRHIATQCAGVVYFKNAEDAIKALKILGDEAKELFK